MLMHHTNFDKKIVELCYRASCNNPALTATTLSVIGQYAVNKVEGEHEDDLAHLQYANTWKQMHD